MFLFCVTAAEAVGCRALCSAMLSPPLQFVGRPDTIHQTFWLSAGYFSLLLLPGLCYGTTGRLRWLALQAACAAGHVGCALFV